MMIIFQDMWVTTLADSIIPGQSLRTFWSEIKHILLTLHLRSYSNLFLSHIYFRIYPSLTLTPCNLEKLHLDTTSLYIYYIPSIVYVSQFISILILIYEKHNCII